MTPEDDKVNTTAQKGTVMGEIDRSIQVRHGCAQKGTVAQKLGQQNVVYKDAADNNYHPENASL